MKADATTLSAGQFVAAYRLLRLLGRGAHGVVWLAEGSSRGQTWALKVVPLPSGSAATTAAAAHAFSRSAEAAMRLVHPGIVQVHAAGTEGLLAWLAMEPVPGSDLTRYLAPSRLLPEPVVLRLLSRTAEALAHAHRLGVVHRDVKPANVLVDWPTDTVKLADFGLARADDGLQTGTGIVLGSPAYMAPEQLAGAPASPRSDLYALGVTLFQLLTGRLPYDANSMGGLLRQVADAPVPDLLAFKPDNPRALARLVGALLAKAPSARPADAAAVAQELHGLAQGWPGRI